MIVLAADHFLFRYGSWSGWKFRITLAHADEEQWWQSHVGPLPPRDPMAIVAAPATVPGRDGSNMDGADGPPSDRANVPFLAYRMNMNSSMMRGSVLVSPTVHAWHIGAILPGGMAVDRFYVGKPGVAPPHPTMGGWQLEILLIGLLLNALILAGPLYLVVASLLWLSTWSVRTVLARYRRRHGECPGCAYIILPGQRQCPECGANTSPLARHGQQG